MKADLGISRQRQGPPEQLGIMETTSRSSSSSAAPESELGAIQVNVRLDIKDAEDTGPSSDRAPKPKGTYSRPQQENEVPASLKLIKQPDTRPISQEQLVAEVKGIYTALVMVESKCIEIDKSHNTQNAAKLRNEQWRALIALQRTLLHEHHDFLLVSQHPFASPALRRLASRYAMPTRMWRHGIHSFLELLRHRLPASWEHMLSSIYLAYSMLSLLYETVPALRDMWMECLGDVARYRMAVEDDEIQVREIWMSVSRGWYSKVSHNAPTTGRLYHHLAILSRPNQLWQLFYYTKSLCVATPFPSTRESITTLFDPVLSAAADQPPGKLHVHTVLVKAHGILFSGKMAEEYTSTVAEFIDNLDDDIGKSARWMELGYLVAITSCCSLLSYGKDDNVLCRSLGLQRADDATEAVNITEPSDKETGKQLEPALHLADSTHEKVFGRLGDPKILPYVHVVLAFLSHLKSHSSAMDLVDGTFPWKLLSELLNSFLLSYWDYKRILEKDFPRPAKGSPRPLPEDLAMRGLPWVETYFPTDWFSQQVDYDEQYLEMASMTEERKERVLWLGVGLAKLSRWLVYDETKNQFAVAD